MTMCGTVTISLLGPFQSHKNSPREQRGREKRKRENEQHKERIKQTKNLQDWTMAPEILLCMDYTEAVDVFSYGMILCELISRVAPSATNFKRVIPGFGIDPVCFFFLPFKPFKSQIFKKKFTNIKIGGNQAKGQSRLPSRPLRHLHPVYK